MLAVFDALLGVDKCYLTPLGMVGTEEGGTAPVLVDSGEFVGKVVDVCQTRVESKTARRWKRMRCIASPVI